MGQFYQALVLAAAAAAGGGKATTTHSVHLHGAGRRGGQQGGVEEV